MKRRFNKTLPILLAMDRISRLLFKQTVFWHFLEILGRITQSHQLIIMIYLYAIIAGDNVAD